MNWDNIKKRIAQKEKGAVPEQGYLLAYTVQQVIFRKYHSLDELDTVLKKTEIIGDTKDSKTAQKDILEIHLFNEEKEYRALASKSKRTILSRDLCGIEHIADFKSKEIESVYIEKIQLEQAFIKPENGIEKEYITVLNHISYNEYGIARVDDYRLVMED